VAMGGRGAGTGSLDVSGGGTESLIWVQERRFSRPVYQWRQDRKAFKASKACRVLKGLRDGRVRREQQDRWVRQVPRDFRGLQVQPAQSVPRDSKAFRVSQGLKVSKGRREPKVRLVFKVQVEVQDRRV
jgi:hypothetical protein